MKEKEKKKYLEMLELDLGASFNDIEQSYKELLELYKNEDSIELSPLRNELDENEKEKIIFNITSAYNQLISEKPASKDIELGHNEDINVELPEELGEPEEINGEYFKKVRENLGLKLKDVSEEMGVSSKLINSLEYEKFSKFDDDGYLRWLVMKYAQFLNIDKKRSAEDYMKLYRASK